MNSKERLSQRFDDMGRFMAADICALPGILENISREGCKICYQFAVSVDMDTDYEAKITFARAASEGYRYQAWLSSNHHRDALGAESTT